MSPVGTQQPHVPEVRLDHLIFAALDLDAAVDDLERRLGVRAAPGGKHPGPATHNALMDLGGGAYLEIIAPDPDRPAPATPRPFGLDGLTTPRLTGWAVQCSGIADAVSRARHRGYDPGDPWDMERVTATGDVLRWQLTPATATGGPVPFLIDWGTTTHPSATSPSGLVLESLHIEHPSAAQVSRSLDAIGIQVDVVEADEFAIVAHLGGPLGRVELR